MRKLGVIGLGGFCGAILRYLVAFWLQALSSRAGFPYGTLAANLGGCLGIGIWMGSVFAMQTRLGSATADYPLPLRLFFLVGFLGSFTTFSTFGYETFAFLRTGRARLAFAYLAASLLGGLLAVGLGWWVGRSIG